MKPETLLFSPADHVMLVMDREIQAGGMPGSWCGFGLELAGIPRMSEIRQGLTELTQAFPTLTGRIIRKGKRYGWQSTDQIIPLFHHKIADTMEEDSFIQHAIMDIMNSSPDAFAHHTRPLVFHLIEGRQKTILLARWLHPLLDAGGVKRLFDFLMSSKADRQKYLQNDHSLIFKKLRDWPWWHKLRLFWRGKNHNEWIDRLNSSLPTPESTSHPIPRQLANKRLKLTNNETRHVLENLQRQVGLGGQSLYFIACLMRALEMMGPAVRKDAWCIPYAFNLRPGNAPVPVTGNQVSVLFAQASHEIVKNRKALFAHLKRQNADTVRQELDMAYLPLMWLGQWLSLEKFGHILRHQHSGGERSSAWFSDIGEIRFANAKLLGLPITDVHHATFVTAPPSLAVLFSRFNGQLSAAVNYLQPDLSPQWIEGFCQILKEELLAE